MQIFLLVFMVALALTMWGRSRYLKIYGQETRNALASGLSGAELARRILEHRGLDEVGVVESRQLLGDFYWPDKRLVTLSPCHFRGTNFPSLAIAAQQAGKAIQHHEGHRPLLWRISAIRWTVYLSLPLLFAGVVALGLGMSKTLFPLILLLWSLVAIWNFITIPTELDAGERAKRVLGEMKVFRNLDERVGVERVMGAASTAYLDGLSTLGSWVAGKLLPWLKRGKTAEKKT